MDPFWIFVIIATPVAIAAFIWVIRQSDDDDRPDLDDLLRG
jgi:nitrogen fixation-related uncharacterized protein